MSTNTKKSIDVVYPDGWLRELSKLPPPPFDLSGFGIALKWDYVREGDSWVIEGGFEVDQDNVTEAELRDAEAALMAEGCDNIVRPDFGGNGESTQGRQRNPNMLHYKWDGDSELVFPLCLIEDIMTEGSIGFAAGESGAGKSFTAIDLALAVALGQPFFGKLTLRGGVVYIASEAGGTIPGRMKAARMQRAYPLVKRGDITLKQANSLPIVVIDDVPDLAKDVGFNRLITTLRQLASDMLEHHDLPLRLIIIDTMITGFGIESWNDPGDVTSVTNKMKAITRETGAAVLGITHHGKDIARGIAGSFASKANVDTVLSIFVKRVGDDALGDVQSRHIALTKWRDGAEGWQMEFRLESVPIGKRRDGKIMFSAHVVPVENGSRIGTMPKGKKEKSEGRALRAFKDAFNEAAISHGETVKVQGDGPQVPAVLFEHVRDVFGSRYIPEDKDAKKAAAAVRQAFKRGLEAATARWGLLEGNWGGKSWLWRLADKV